MDNYDYLGLCIDKKLDIKSHIDKLVNKVGFKLYTLILIYKVMTMPHFDYVDFIIDSATKKCTDRIEKLHKRAVRKNKK